MNIGTRGIIMMMVAMTAIMFMGLSYIEETLIVEKVNGTWMVTNVDGHDIDYRPLTALDRRECKIEVIKETEK